MRIMTVLSAGCLFAGLMALTAAGTASAQEIHAPPAAGSVYASALYYPYGHPWRPYHAYQQAVHFGCVPVAPPKTLCHGPMHYFGCDFYGPPYYAYPRPPLFCPGYAGFSGCDPNAYRTMVPPPIPTPSELPATPQPPTPAPEQLPTPPTPIAPAAESVPTPPSALAPK